MLDKFKSAKAQITCYEDIDRIIDKVSDAHLRLKKIGAKFLLDMKCDDIRTEHKRDLILAKPVIFDLVGLKDKNFIIVECGGIHPDKLQRIYSGFIKWQNYTDNKLYIIPYDRDEPYLWHKSISVCFCCGNKIR